MFNKKLKQQIQSLQLKTRELSENVISLEWKIVHPPLYKIGDKFSDKIISKCEFKHVMHNVDIHLVYSKRPERYYMYTIVDVKTGDTDTLTEEWLTTALVPNNPSKTK